MDTCGELTLTLSIAAIVAREAVSLTATAHRIIEESDKLIQDHLAKPGDLVHHELSALAMTIERQQALMSALSANALTAVRLASKHLTAALAQAQAQAQGAEGHWHDDLEDQRSAAHFLRALGDLERTILRSEQQMRDVSRSVAQSANRAENQFLAAQSCARLIDRVSGRPPR